MEGAKLRLQSTPRFQSTDDGHTLLYYTTPQTYYILASLALHVLLSPAPSLGTTHSH